MNYEVQVDDLLIDGHPHLQFCFNLEQASKLYDELVKKYTYHTVRMTEIRRIPLACHLKQQKPVPEKCPRGHLGLIDGRNVIVKGTKEGVFECKVCGLFQEG